MAFLINDKAELAFVSVIQDAAANALVRPGKSADVKSLPIVICSANGQSEEDPKGTGNFWVEVATEVKSAAFQTEQLPDGGELPDMKLRDEALATSVFEALMVDDLPQKLSDATDDFFVFPSGTIVGAPMSGRDESGIWIDSLTIRIYCCGKDLS